MPCAEHDQCEAAASSPIPIRVTTAVVDRGALAAPPDLALTWPSGLRLQLPMATEPDGW